MKRLNLTLSIVFATLVGVAQTESETIKKIFNEALTDRTAYMNLRFLCSSHGSRITGSPGANEAADYTYRIMTAMEVDSVYKQDVMVPRWVRGDLEEAAIVRKGESAIRLPVTALGLSIGTGERGLQANIIEVKDFDELEKIGTTGIEGKIVFFNHPMDPTLLNTFAAYGEAAAYRTNGAARAAAYGAVGVVVRSLTTALDNYPHAGVMRYQDGMVKIPVVAISTNGAEVLSRYLKQETNLEFYFRTTCGMRPDVLSHNVIGEIQGSEFPDEIITVGGHLDAWNTGEGAHDDGAGCMQSIEVLRIFKKLGIQPKRTIRAVMFMDEEVAQSGGKAYFEEAKQKGEKHYFALESDRGAFMPRGFGFSAPDERIDGLLELAEYFKPYGIYEFTKGGGGVDIGPLKEFGTPLCSFVPDMQRYFDVHHSGLDTFEQVNFREMQLGSAAIAALLYLIDKNDL